jgi:hypothetical protein
MIAAALRIAGTDRHVGPRVCPDLRCLRASGAFAADVAARRTGGARDRERWNALAVVTFPLFLGCGVALGDWPQWGNNPPHQGRAAVVAQPPAAIVADIVYDPFSAAETAEAGSGLLVHYAVPLLDETGVYLESKSGTYVSCVPPGSGQPAPCGPDAWNSQFWNLKKLVWRRGAFTEAWSFASDWKPAPNAGALGGWEPVFHPVLAGPFAYAPGFGGSVFRLARDTGAVRARVSPFGALDANTFVAGGLSADSAGNVYYNAIRLDPADPWGIDVRESWLARIGADGSSAVAPFSGLVAGAPARDAACERSFSPTDLPWPPSATAAPPTGPCGSQRPGLNVVPAIAPDGTIYTVSRAHFNGRYGFLVAVRPDLSPRWAASLRGFLNDGCDVLLPASGTPGGCRAGSLQGVDPATNGPPAGRVADQGSSSPVVLPDGAILYGALTGYNYQRGHLFKFSAAGEPVASYDFGWDITPAVFSHGSTYSILIKDNHYGLGSYCGDPDLCPPEKDRYDITSLDANLLPEWHFTGTNTESCARGPDGGVFCVWIIRTVSNGVSISPQWTRTESSTPTAKTDSSTRSARTGRCAERSF